MASKSRSTTIAQMLEHFLDENEENLPPNMFKELDELAGNIDDGVSEMEVEIEKLNNNVEELENKIEELEG